MRLKRHLVVPVLLAAMLAGCAAPMAAADFDLVDGDDLAASEAGPLDAAPLERCWGWLNDSLLGDLAGRPGLTPTARAEVAERYSSLRASQAKIENARGYLAVQQDNLEIARFRERAGLVTARDALQADAERATVAAAIPGLEVDITASASRLAVLTGEAPAGLRARLAPPGPVPTEPAEVPQVALRDLMGRRADLVEAQERFRRLAWTGGGKARASYRETLLAAFADVQAARAAFDGAVARALGLATATEKMGNVARLAREQYRDGQADYAALAAAERALLTSRDVLTQARADRAASAIRLCVALGGGQAAAPAGG